MGGDMQMATRGVRATYFAAALLLGAALPTRAALIPIDSGFGPDSAVLDTSTGLEWLNLSFSVDVSPRQVLGQLGAGGAYAGFRYATIPEFTNLTTSYFGTPVCCLGNLSLTATENFANLFGPTTVRGDGLPLLSGFYGAQTVPSELVITSAFFYQSGPGGVGLVGTFDQDSGPPLDTRDPGIGSYLVRSTAPVPEPASLALLGSGLLGLGVLRQWRRCKAA